MLNNINPNLISARVANAGIRIPLPITLGKNPLGTWELSSRVSLAKLFCWNGCALHLGLNDWALAAG